jgi:hypothetical protein
MRKKLIIASAVIIFVIVVIAGTMIILHGKQEKNNDYPVEVGYFLKYNCTYGEEISVDNNKIIINYDYNNMFNESYEILSVNGELLNYNYITPWHDGIEENISKEHTYFAMIPDLYYTTPYMSITPLGNATIDTKWGTISTEHYFIHLFNHGYYEWWIYNGVLIKAEIADYGNPAYEMTLTDTNIPRLTGLQ